MEGPGVVIARTEAAIRLGERERRARTILEVTTAVLLGLVSVSTAVGAYQAANWGQRATDYAATSQQLRDENLSGFITATLISDDDSGKLLDALALETQKTLTPERAQELDSEITVILRSASPQLEPAWNAFVGSGYDAAHLPLNDADYTSSLYAVPASQNYVSYVADRLSHQLIDRSSAMTVVSLIFAVSLLLLGVAGVSSSWRISATLAGLGALAYLAGAVVVILVVL